MECRIRIMLYNIIKIIQIGGLHMKLSISMYSLHRAIREGKADLPGFLKFAKGLGVDAVELLSVYWGEDVDKEVAEAKKLVDSMGLVVSAYDVGNNFVKEDPAERQVQIDDVKKGVDIALALGAPTVRVFCGDSSNRTPEFVKKATEWIIESFKPCAAYAEEKGVNLGIENHGLFAGRSDQLIEIMDRVGSSNLGLTFDTGNFLLVDEDPGKAIDVVKDKVFHVHFKDFAALPADTTETNRVYTSLAGKKYRACIGGQGSVDLAKISRALGEAGYKGWLSIEFEGPEDPFVGTEESVKFAKGL